MVKDHPVADALFGVDNTFLTRALDDGMFEPYTATGLDTVSRRSCNSTRAPRHADRQRRRVRRTTTSRGSATTATRPRRRRSPTSIEARVQEAARGREPGDVVARARVPARDDLGVRRRRLAGLLEVAARERRARRRRLGPGVRDRLHRGRRRAATVRSSCRTAPTPRPTSCSPTARRRRRRSAWCRARASRRSSSRACCTTRRTPRARRR